MLSFAFFTCLLDIEAMIADRDEKELPFHRVVPCIKFFCSAGISIVLDQFRSICQGLFKAGVTAGLVCNNGTS